MGSGEDLRTRVIQHATLVVLLLFCLVNPFAGWAYLATSRARLRPQEAPISGGVTRERLVVLPVSSTNGSPSLVRDWLEEVSSGLEAFDALEALVYPESEPSVEPGRDPIALGRSVEADLVVDASLSRADGTVRLSVRLLRVEDSSVRWLQFFETAPENVRDCGRETVVGVIRTLAMPQGRR